MRDNQMCVMYEPFEELRGLDVEKLVDHIGWFVFMPYRDMKDYTSQRHGGARQVWYDFMDKNLISAVMARHQSIRKDDGSSDPASNGSLQKCSQ